MIFRRYHLAARLLIIVIFILELSACHIWRKANPPPDMSKTRPTPLNKNTILHMEKKQKNTHL
jgi:hypothetical protein